MKTWIDSEDVAVKGAEISDRITKYAFYQIKTMLKKYAENFWMDAIQSERNVIVGEQAFKVTIKIDKLKEQR